MSESFVFKLRLKVLSRSAERVLYVSEFQSEWALTLMVWTVKGCWTIITCILVGIYEWGERGKLGCRWIESCKWRRQSCRVFFRILNMGGCQTTLGGPLPSLLPSPSLSRYEAGRRRCAKVGGINPPWGGVGNSLQFCTLSVDALAAAITLWHWKSAGPDIPLWPVSSVPPI